MAAGCKGPHAIAEFAQSLNHAQRRQLGCRRRPGHLRECDVPSERTFRRVLKKVDPDQLKDALEGWMQKQDPTLAAVVHVDGKVVKNTQPAPARAQAASPAPVPEEPCEIPPQLHKPKADKALPLVNFQTTDQRLVDQVAVPQDTNEEAAVRRTGLLTFQETRCLIARDNKLCTQSELGLAFSGKILCNCDQWRN